MSSSYTGTGLKSVRAFVPPAEKANFAAAADDRGQTMTEAIRAAMELYVDLDVPTTAAGAIRLAQVDPDRYARLAALGVLKGAA